MNLVNPELDVTKDKIELEGKDLATKILTINPLL